MHFIKTNAKIQGKYSRDDAFFHLSKMSPALVVVK